MVRWQTFLTLKLKGTKMRRLGLFMLVLLLATLAVKSGAQTGNAPAQSAPQTPPAQTTATPGPAANTRSADEAAIRQTALDYIEGWYEGNGERMERSLHPDLAKRIVITSRQNNRSRLDQMSALSLVQATRAGGGRETPRERQQKDVTILDIYENVASVKVVASDWIDYMQMARFNGRWVIVNVLWEMKPREGR